MVTFSYQNVIYGENIVMYLVCKQFEKTMFMLLIVLKMVETTFTNFQEGFSLISPKLHRLCA